MLRIFLMVSNRVGSFNSKKRASASRMLVLKDGGVATLSAKDSVATPTISNRAAANEIGSYDPSSARNSTHLKNVEQLGNPFPAHPTLKAKPHPKAWFNLFLNKNQYPSFCCQSGFLYISFWGIGARYLSLRLPDVLIAFSLSLRAAITCGSNCSRTMSNQRMPNSPANS